MRVARLLKVLGLAWMGFFALLGSLFIAGETLTDPGGWQAVGLIAVWLVPLVALGILAWYRPAPATVVLATLVSLAIVLSIWFAVDPGSWRSFENDVGPVRAIVVFALMVPIAVLGWRRPLVAGLMLLVVCVVPVILSGIGSRQGLASMSAVSIPGVITGLLYLLSAWAEAGKPQRSVRTGAASAAGGA